jgi:hypothetical protein
MTREQLCTRLGRELAERRAVARLADVAARLPRALDGA